MTTAVGKFDANREKPNNASDAAKKSAILNAAQDAYSPQSKISVGKPTDKFDCNGFGYVPDTPGLVNLTLTNDAANKQAFGDAMSIHSAGTSISHWFTANTADFNSIFKKIESETPAGLRALEKSYSDMYGTEMLDDLKSKLKPADYERLKKLIGEKNTNDVPVDQRADGSSLIKDSAYMHVGMNHLTTPDGRAFNLYIPQNARQEIGPHGKPGIPLVVAMHGVEPNSTTPDLMERESGLNIEAERKGVAVAFLRPEYRPESALFGAVQIDVGAWNMKGTPGFLPEDPSYDDAKFVDNVLQAVKNGLNVDSSRVGMIGMSDGGRFAQDYAASRPGTISSVVSFEGTRMANDSLVPKAGENVMIVHGLDDHTLPWDETGWWSRGILSVAASAIMQNTQNSRPADQVSTWLKADGIQGPTSDQWRQVTDYGSGGPTPQSDDGVTRTYDYKGPGGEVQVNLVRGAEHAIDDYKNAGGMPLGRATYLDFSSKGVDFILDHPNQHR
jgi:poly(3-hydroxybutyrate) depolymerase